MIILISNNISRLALINNSVEQDEKKCASIPFNNHSFIRNLSPALNSK